MIQKDIQSIGLNEKEAKVYLASLELGQATVQRIAEKANIKRPTTYFIIEGLMDRGLISSFYQGKKQYFVAEMPERILDLIAKERKELDLREEQFKRLLPELQSINNRNRTKPVVKYYEGKEGILTMVDEHVKTSRGQRVYSAYSRDIVDNFLTPEELSTISKNRTENKIQVKTIYTWTKRALPTDENSERAQLSPEEFPITCDIAMYEDKLRIASLKDRFVGIVIEDKEIAKSFRAIFDLAWKWAQSQKEKK